METTFHDKEAVMVEQLLTRYRDRLAGVLSLYGLPPFCKGFFDG